MRTLVLTTFVLLLFGAAGRAQEPAPRPQDGGAPPLLQGLGDGMRPAEVQRLFDAYLIMEAQQALVLTDAQYPQFLTRLRTLQETRRRNQQQRTQLMNELQRLTSPRLAPPPADALIKDRLNVLQELESRTAAELRKAYNAVDEVLDVRQQARFRVFEEMVERRKIDLLLRSRQKDRSLPPRPLRQPPPQEP